MLKMTAALLQRVLLGSVPKMTTVLLYMKIQHGVHRQKYLCVQLYPLMEKQHVGPLPLDSLLV